MLNDFIFTNFNDEDSWANEEIEKWENKNKQLSFKQYIDEIVHKIWYRLIRKFSPEFLKSIKFDKKSLKELITSNEKRYLYSTAIDYFYSKTPVDEASNLLFDEIYRQLSKQR